MDLNFASQLNITRNLLSSDMAKHMMEAECPSLAFPCFLPPMVFSLFPDSRLPVKNQNINSINSELKVNKNSLGQSPDNFY